LLIVFTQAEAVWPPLYLVDMCQVNTVIIHTMRTLLIAALLALPLVAVAEYWCWDGDFFELELVDADLQITHFADLINCCPDPITFEVHVGDATIFVVEHWEDPCDCECCTDIKVTLLDVPAGPWIINYSWFDIEIWDWTFESFQVEVPDLGQGYVPELGEIWDSDCLDPTGLPGSPELPICWSSVKVLYR
jgi:hypothetical protein